MTGDEVTSSEMTERRLFYPLSAKDREALTRCETTVGEGLTTFLDVGLALTEIRTNKLYRGAYKSFETYCRDRWNMSSRQANRQIQAARVAGMISPGPIGPAPKSESQARPLVKLRDDPAAVQKAWTQAVDDADGQEPTAEQVKAAVQQHQHLAPSPKPQPPAPDIEHRRRCERTGRANDMLTEAANRAQTVLRQAQAGQIDQYVVGSARVLLDRAQQLVTALENTEILTADRPPR